MNPLSIKSLVDNPPIVIAGWFLIHSLWQSTLIASGIAIVLFSMRRTSAQLRYLVACAGLLAMIGTPLLTSVFWTRGANVSEANPQFYVGPLNLVTLPQGQFPSAMPSTEHVNVFSTRPISAPLAAEDGSTWIGLIAQVQHRFSATTAGFAQKLTPWFPLIVAIWILGIALLATRFIAGLRLVRILRNSARPLSDTRCSSTLNRLMESMAIRSAVRLVKSNLATVPAVIGWFRPMILVPASMVSGLSVSELEALLAHELAHIRRHDYLVNVVQSLVETFLFFHPLVWWLSRVIRVERENCCDDIAIEVCGNRIAFARALARMEELRSDQNSFVLAASGGSLVRRIRRVVGRDVVRGGSWMGTSAMVLVLLIGFLATVGIAIAGIGILPDKAVASPRVAQQENVNDGANRNGTQTVVPPSESVADADTEAPPPIKIISTDNGHVTKCRATSQAGGRSAAELLEHFAQTIPRGDKHWQGSIVNQETIVSAQPRSHLENGMDADVVNFSLPEGAGMQALFSGSSVDIETDKSRTILTLTDGRVDLIDAVGVTRATASADGGANQLIVECTTANQEAALVIRTNKEDCPVQVRMVVETGAPADEKDPPHGAIRYTILPQGGASTAPVRMKMQWHYDLKLLAQEAAAADPNKMSIPEANDNRQRFFNKNVVPISDPAAANELDQREPAKAEDWGPRPKQGDLRARLTLQTEKPTAGQPLRLKLEIKNFGTEPQEFDPQHYSPFRTVKVIHANGEPDWFIGPIPQTAGVESICAPGESITVWDDMDATELFMLDEGEYTIKAAITWTQDPPTLPESNELRVVVMPGDVPPLKKAILSLKDSLPENWQIATGYGAISIVHSPTGLKKDVNFIQIWFTAEKLPNDFQLGEGENHQVVRYGGKHALGHANIAASPHAEELWPGYFNDVQKALGLDAPDSRQKNDLDENRLDPKSQTTAEPIRLSENSERTKPWVATGRVTDGEGSPIAEATVRAYCGIGTLRETGEATTDAQGYYKLNFGPGIFSEDKVNLQAATISVQLAGHFEKNLHRQGDMLAANTLPEGEIGWGGKKPEDVFLPGITKTIDFVMLPAARFRGTVIDQDGKKLSGVRISLTGDELPPSSSVVAQTRTDDSGRFEIDDIPTGFKFQILIEPAKAESPWLAWASPPIEFVADDSNDAHLRYAETEKVINFSVQSLTLQLHGEGVNWKTSLEQSKSKSFAPKYDGLSNGDGTIVSAGMAWIELGK